MRVLVTFLLLCAGLLGYTQGDSTTIVPAKPKQQLFLSHEYSFFDRDLVDWHTSTIGARWTKNSWVLLPKFSVANRFSENGWLIEPEAYKKLKSGDYIYLMAGGSPSTIFYRYSGAFEYYNPFKEVWEHSAGVRYMQFQNDVQIGLITASVSKYSGRFLSILRAGAGYSFNLETLAAVFGTFQQRYYHSDDAYSTLFFSYGYDPDILLFTSQKNFDINKVQVMGVGLNTFQRLSNHWLILGQLEYQYYTFSNFNRNQYSAALKLIYEY